MASLSKRFPQIAAKIGKKRGIIVDNPLRDLEKFRPLTAAQVGSITEVIGSGSDEEESLGAKRRGRRRVRGRRGQVTNSMLGDLQQEGGL